MSVAEDLQALPLGSIVLDRSGIAWQHQRRAAIGIRWHAADGVLASLGSGSLARDRGPLTVLYRPDTMTVSVSVTREGIYRTIQDAELDVEPDDNPWDVIVDALMAYLSGEGERS